MKTSGLEVRGLRAGHGRTTVVHGVDLTVRPGQIVALLGPNGAGKTTTMLALAGALRPLAGTVSLDGHDLTGRPAHLVARTGIRLVPQDRGLFPSLTVREHLDLRAHKKAAAAAFELFPALETLADRRARLLSGGEQQMLALATAVLGQPRIVLIDELSNGLAPIVVQRLLPTLRTIADRGPGLLLVEQHVDAALHISDHVYVLGRGKVVLTGTSAEVRARRTALEAAYLDHRPTT